MNEILRNDSYLLVMGYPKPIIHNGLNWDQAVEGLDLDKEEFEVLNRFPKNYEFNKDHQVH